MNEHPIRLVVTDDLARKRLTTFFRWFLAIPHLVWLFLWTIAAFVAGVANWVATLALGRAPAPLHRFLASYVKYVTQLYAYVNLVADPYPPFDGRDGYPVDARIDAPTRQRRWTVVLRGVLAIPALVIAATLLGAPGWAGAAGSARPGTSFSFQAGLLHSAALLVWFLSLARARSSRGLRDAGVYALSYGAQLWAYLLLLTDRYPDSDPVAALGGELPLRSDPVGMVVEDDLRRSRLTVLFRLLLAVPHLFWLALWSILAFFAAIANWVSALAIGRSPRRLHRFLAAYVRYIAHLNAFTYLVGNPFPGFVGKSGSYPIEVMIAEPRALSRWKVLFRFVLVIPALLLAGAYGGLLTVVAVLGWFAALITARMPHGLRNAGALALRYQAQLGAYALLLTDSYPYGGPCQNERAAHSPADSEPTPEPA